MKKRLLPFFVLILISSISFGKTYTFKVTVDDAVQACYIAGGFNGWNPAANPMTKISDSPKIFTLDVELSDQDTVGLEYKYCAGPSWKYEQTESANFKFWQMTEEGDVVTSFKNYWDPGQESDVTINVLVPAEVFVCYLTGSFNDWNSTSHQMELVDSTANGKEFTLTIHTLDTTTLEYKFLAGPGWPYEQTNSSNYVYMTDGGTVVCDAFKKIYDPSKVGNITINITVPDGTYEVWVVGSYNSWDIANAIKATKNPDGTYTAVIPDVADIEYKIWCHNDWPYEEAIDESGTSLPSNRTASYESGPVFNITVLYWKQLYVPTGVNRNLINTYRIYSQNGSVIVEGARNEVTIFDISGRMLERARVNTTFVSKTLKSGIYIIRADNQTKKVYVW
ncbi:MAG: T9SS type A sorting domain-containing protein [Bacteroidales bacterium]